MRTRKEIETETMRARDPDVDTANILEVLLDIRDLLIGPKITNEYGASKNHYDGPIQSAAQPRQHSAPAAGSAELPKK